MRRTQSFRWGAALVAALVGTLGCSEDAVAPPPVAKSVAVGAAGFTPAALVIAVQDSVIWNWDAGGIAHNVTFENGPASPTQATGGFGRRFSSQGTFRYRCTVHSTDFSSGMAGSVEVRPSASYGGY